MHIFMEGMFAIRRCFPSRKITFFLQTCKANIFRINARLLTFCIRVLKIRVAQVACLVCLSSTIITQVTEQRHVCGRPRRGATFPRFIGVATTTTTTASTATATRIEQRHGRRSREHWPSMLGRRWFCERRLPRRPQLPFSFSSCIAVVVDAVARSAFWERRTVRFYVAWPRATLVGTTCRSACG